MGCSRGTRSRPFAMQTGVVRTEAGEACRQTHERRRVRPKGEGRQALVNPPGIPLGCHGLVKPRTSDAIKKACSEGAGFFYGVLRGIRAPVDRPTRYKVRKPSSQVPGSSDCSVPQTCQSMRPFRRRWRQFGQPLRRSNAPSPRQAHGQRLPEIHEASLLLQT